MAQKRRGPGATGAAAEGERALGGLTAAVTTGSEAWIDSQAELLEHVDDIAKGWMQRRREALEAARQSLEEMRGCRDVTELLRIQQDWLSGSLQRIASDFEAMSGIFLSYSRQAMSRFGDSARVMGESAREQAALGTAGAKPTRPRE